MVWAKGSNIRIPAPIFIYSHLFNLPSTGLRFFTVYGPWGRPDMALFKFTKAAINGESIEGPYNELFSFVGMHEIPIRHGMTSGELAHMILDKGWIDCDNLDLTVFPILNWDRTKYFDEYDNIWNSPSPNIKTIDAAIAYNASLPLNRTDSKNNTTGNWPLYLKRKFPCFSHELTNAILFSILI